MFVYEPRRVKVVGSRRLDLRAARRIIAGFQGKPAPNAKILGNDAVVCSGSIVCVRLVPVFTGPPRKECARVLGVDSVAHPSDVRCWMKQSRNSRKALSSAAT